MFIEIYYKSMGGVVLNDRYIIQRKDTLDHQNNRYLMTFEIDKINKLETLTIDCETLKQYHKNIDSISDCYRYGHKTCIIHAGK